MGRLLNGRHPVPGAAGRPGTRDAAPVGDLGSAHALGALLERRGERLDDYTKISVNAGRNVVVALARGEGNGVLLKQHRPRGDDRLPMEHAVHTDILDAAALGRGRIFVPGLLRTQARDRLLEFELVPDAVSLADAVGERAAGKKSTAIPVGACAELGEFIGRFHAHTAGMAVPDVLSGSAVDTERLHIVDFSRLTPERYAEFSEGEIQLARTVQRDAPLTAALTRLSRAVEARCLIHGDLRGENVLLPAGSTDRMAVIDWELCRLSDPAVGAFSLS
ncbi:hypothetical protein SXANM310S_07424 [Streptomyces xanthochromogenes]